MTEPDPSESLKTELRLAQATVAELSQRLDELLTQHQLLPTAPAALAGRGVGVGTGDDIDPSTVITGRRPARAQISGSWQQMPPALAAAAWQSLTGWVDELIRRYELQEQVPACWYQHGPIVEELHALHLAWYGAFGAPDATPTAPADWHNYLQTALTRTRHWDTRGCTSGEHRAAPAPPDDPQARAERQLFIQADLDTRARDEQARTATPST